MVQPSYGDGVVLGGPTTHLRRYVCSSNAAHSTLVVSMRRHWWYCLVPYVLGKVYVSRPDDPVCLQVDSRFDHVYGLTSHTRALWSLLPQQAIEECTHARTHASKIPQYLCC